MKIDAAVRLLSKLPIRDRDSGRAVPFHLNHNQQKLVAAMREQELAGRPIRWICCKARRVGVSSIADGFLWCHSLSQPMANARIVAHLDDSVSELFKVPLGLTAALRERVSRDCVEEPTKTLITFPHAEGNSHLSIATAGSTQGGRGAGISALHLSESSFYRGADSFISLLNTVPNHRDTMVCIESTANGKVGTGQTFYEAWCSAIKGESDYLPIFLSWLDDPTCVRNPDEAKDAPADQDEKDLMKHFHASRAQIAWRRWAIPNLCSGYLEKLYQEYPVTWEEAFVSTGNPAFVREELAAARASVRKGVSMEWLRKDDHSVTFREGGDGALIFWAQPDPTHKYYLGADAAQGQGEGDFAAAVVLDGTTNEVVARFADRVTPATLAILLNALGRYFCNAMVNIELTGGWGDWAQSVLRDKFRYPNFYLWKGLDDKAQQPRKRNAMGWTTTWRSRERLFTSYRDALREQELSVRDEQVVVQMEQAEREAGRWEVKRGHDDILFAMMLANVACQHYPPMRRAVTKKQTPIEADPEESLREHVRFKPSIHVDAKKPDDFYHKMITEHFSRSEVLAKRREKGMPPTPLEGI